MSRVLILSDGRMGHLNQSIAYAKNLNYSYDIVEIRFKNKLAKIFSYLLDRLCIQVRSLFDAEISQSYDIVVGTGSSVYYATKVLAKQMGAKSVVMMLPKGYRLDFDVIFAQKHDHPPKAKNIIEIPANFSSVEPKGYYKAKQKSIGIVIGGNNKRFGMSVEDLKVQLDYIITQYQSYEIAVTTSPRTPKSVEKLLESYHFDYEVIFSKNAINPIGDFLDQCETVFITADSTSMISESVSYGECNIVVLPLKSTKENKFTSFVDDLAKEGYLYLFDGKIENKNRKIDFKQYIQKAHL